MIFIWGCAYIRISLESIYIFSNNLLKKCENKVKNNKIYYIKIRVESEYFKIFRSKKLKGHVNLWPKGT
jgi:hypothetical protein